MEIIQMPGYLAAEELLTPGEKIVCKNATIIVDKDNNISGWVNNDSMITFIINEEEE